MSKCKATLLLVVSILVVVSPACNLLTSPAAPTANPDESNPEEQPTEEVVGEAPTEAPGQVPTEAVEPTPTSIPSAPIGLYQGLGGLNSYRLNVSIISDGPTPQDKNHSLYQVDYNSEGDKSLIHSESVSSTAKNPEESHSASDQYYIGNKNCSVLGSGTDREAKLSDVNIRQKEMLDI